MSHQETLLRERLREAALALRDLRLERDALERERSEPIAIVGMGCRLPGAASSPQAFWDLLTAGRDAIVSLEPRWRLIGAHPDSDVPSWAALLTESVEAFDPAFFGISPREARSMDPQQRLLLEVAWEALEDAGIPPLALAQSRTGVFIGACANDYADLAGRQPPAEQDAYLTTGNMLSIAAGRLSYTLGLQGPCMTIDTACSSSLVALHVACRSLRSHESSLALAGGVSLILSPDSMTALFRTQALSPDGRCRTFDALANGYARGEGCGLLVLKRLSDAQRDGDRIWAVIRGSAVNQDGRSTGLTAPNVLAQEALLRQALKDARVAPEAIGFVETHGTGTSLGDPIEVQALRAVVGAPRADGSRCVLGAVKTNIGHLEGAAGAAGLIKAVLALAMERIPKNLHLRTLNAHIELDGSSLVLASEPVPWPRSTRPRFAGVSGFGLSGTNAHVVLEEAPPPRQQTPTSTSALPFVLSARSEAALAAQAEQLSTQLARCHDTPLPDLAYTLCCRRTQFEHRASIVAHSRDDLHAALVALAHGQSSPFLRTATVRRAGKLAYLFTGQGSQRPAMGQALASAFPAFSDALHAVLAVLDPLLPRPLRTLMWAGKDTDDARLLDQTRFTQPALFALQVALYRLLEGLGITPDFLLGHSVGEIAAAHVAGVLSLADACRLVVARGQHMQELAAGGAMVALQAAEHEVRPLLAGRDAALDIAAINGPQHTVISGDEEAVLSVASHFAARGRKVTRLAVRHAFHSPRMDAMAPAFVQAVSALTFRPSQIAIVSSTSGALITDPEIAQPAYWVKQARVSVQFQRGLHTLREAGVQSYLELGPKAVLCAMAAECFADAAAPAIDLIPTLRGDDQEPSSFLQALGRLHIRGTSVDFSALLRPLQPQLADLPRYPFQRIRCWIDAPPRSHADGSSGLSSLPHPLLTTALSLSDQDAYLFNGALAVRSSPWLLDHAIYSVPIFPGTGFLDAALSAARALDLSVVAELTLSAPLSPSESSPVQLQVLVHPPNAQGMRSFAISSRAVAAPLKSPWTQHGTGFLSSAAASALPSAPPTWPPAGAEAVDISGLYAAFSRRGLGYGPAYQGLRAVYRVADAVYIEATLPEPLRRDGVRYAVHPALLDTTLHGLAAVLSDEVEEHAVMLVAWQGVRVVSLGALTLRARLDRPSWEQSELVSTSLVAWDDCGQLVLVVEQVTLKRVRVAQLSAARTRQSLYGVQWTQVAATPAMHALDETWGMACSSPHLRALATVELDDAHALDQRLRAGPPPARLIVDATEPATQSPPAAAYARIHRVLPLLQSLLRDDRLTAVDLLVVTRNAVSVGPQDAAPVLDQAPLWGLVRCARNEHFDRRLRILDIDAASHSEQIEAALREDTQPELALRAGVLYAPRLAPLAAELTAQPAASSLSRLAQGTTLITGGTGELAKNLCRHLVLARGARHVLLASRRGMQADGAADLVQDLAAHGASVRIVACDVTDARQLSALLCTIPAAAPLRAVFHCAAVLDDAPLSALSAERVDRVFAPKLDAAWHLHELTRSLDLDAFVLFSSAASILGAPGQANYAAANAFLDALAMVRRQQGLPAQSLAWGPWQSQGQGLTAKLAAAQIERQRFYGIDQLSPDEGIALLDAALARSEALVVPIRLISERMFARLRDRRDLVPPILRGLGGSQRAHKEEMGMADAVALQKRLRALSTAEQTAEVLQRVRREVAAVLGLPSESALLPEQALRDLGLDSLMAVELRNRLQVLLAVRFDLSAIWRITTLHDFAAELVRLLSQQRAETEPASPAAEPTESQTAQPVLAPLSAGQTRLYFLDRVLERRHTYNLCMAFRIRPALRSDLLRSALEQLIARHEQLRACFVEHDGQPRQRILPWVEPPLAVMSLTVEEEKRDPALNALLEREVHKPFDLSRAPLFRVLLIQLDPSESALAVLWHHITSDGASVAIFLSELSAAYQAAREGTTARRAIGPSYVRYTEAQRAWLQSDACAAQRAFWAGKLKDVPALDLPSDRMAPRQRSERGGLVPFTLPKDVSAQLEALAKRLRSTPFVIVCAAWSALLGRLSGQDDFAFGVTMAGRSSDSLRDAIGFFVNTVPLRCPLSSEQSGREYIRRMHEEVWSALEQQELPLDEIVRVVAPERLPGFIGSPLFRTCVSYNEHHPSLDTFLGATVVRVADPVIEKVGGTSKFDLLLSVMKYPQAVSAALEYSTDLFDHATMERWSSHFITLLTSLVQQPEQKISELPLLTPEQRHEIVVAWNDTAAAYPQDRCIHQIFEAQVQRSPDAIAVVFQAQRLSYSALNEQANQLAHRLRVLGVQPNALVALCVERSVEMVVAILGVLKAGAAYVPIDPDSPADRIDFMLQDTQPAALLTQHALCDRLPLTSVPTLHLDDPALLADQPTDNLPCLSTPTSLAYVIYTSGSTGRPKGVLMEQHAVNNLLQALNRRAWGPAPLRTAMLAPIFFDMSVKPLLGALLYGHTLHIVDRETRRDGRALLAFFAQHGIEWSDCTPSILALLVDAGLSTRPSLALQVLLCGGEALPTALVGSVYAPGLRQGLQIINVYGPTETCVNVNANPVTAQTLDTSRSTVPMGRPFENTRLYILDARLQPVPVGVPGELHIGGVGLARGYLNRPDLTAEKFIADPFRSQADERIYKTGDRARFYPDGKIEFLGRIDHQVKIHGYRIELGEIEAALSTHPSVAACVVVAREDKPGDKRLVAYVVPQPGGSIAIDELRPHLAKQLPQYMLPAMYVSLPALPLTRNGKIDRRALPAPEREPARTAFVPPAGPLEQALASLFCSVLRLPRMGRHDDFFALGGDSLRAVRAVMRAQHAGIALSVSQLFRAPTLALLSAALSGSANTTLAMLLKPGQAPGAVVLIPGAGGVLQNAQDLASALAVDVPVYGLLSPALAGHVAQPQSVADLAALYARDLALCIPQGPLILLGYSFGGAVAIELAASLLRQQRPVDRVILLDARPGTRGAAQELDERTAISALLQTLGIPEDLVPARGQDDALAGLTSLLVPDLRDTPKTQETKGTEGTEEAQETHEAGGLRGFFALLLDNARRATQQLAAWQPHLPPLPVHLLRVEGPADEAPDYGWSQHGDLASVQVIPGEHYSLLRPPYLDSTMAAIRALLEHSALAPARGP
ncbi:MAG: amino acid adenylation domain-containing protein [Myxococcales bacterium]|nr:amino acid adenylation domain-containing protein [Myxococcales bacterium]